MPNVLIDTHCHIQDPKFASDREAVLGRALAAGVSELVVIGYEMASSEAAVQLAERFDYVHAAAGVHPHDARAVTPRHLDRLARLAESPRVVAIGEIGLDFYRDLSPRDVQKRVFREQLEVASSAHLPVVVHTREANEETFEILGAYAHENRPSWPQDRLLGVMHCFAGDLALALRYIEIGFIVSIAGTCTYPSAEQTQVVAQSIPLRSMVVETDAPYLPPQSHRGHRNEPAYLSETVQYIADLRGTTSADVAAATANTARRLFGLKQQRDHGSKSVIEAR